MKRGFNKKAISAIVATVLIILITVAAVTIIWAAIIPMINKGLESGADCLEANSNLEIDYACINITHIEKNQNNQLTSLQANLYVTVKRKEGDFKLEDMQFIGKMSNGETASVKLSESNNTGAKTLPGQNEKRSYYIDLTGGKPIVTWLYLEKLNIAPIISAGKKSTLCSAAFEKSGIKECEGSTYNITSIISPANTV